MAESWQKNKRLAETNLHMLENNILCDVTFLAGKDRHEVRAHKYMLVSRSPVFYAMFCGPIAELRDTIEIPDLDVECFKHLLRFLYTEACDITPDTVMSLLYAGKKYDVGALVAKCKEYLESEISTENVCVILQQAHMFDEQDLVQQCLSFVFRNGDTVLKSSGCVALGKEVLRLVIASDLLKAKEENVYEACIKWAEEDCRKQRRDTNDANSRESLGDLVNLIRFPLMTLETFKSLVSDGELLTDGEKVDVYMCLTTKTERTSMFLTKLRKPDTIYIQIKRFDDDGPTETCSLDYGSLDYGSTEAIDFQCSETVTLIGVSLYTCEQLNHGTLEVLANDDQLLSMEIELSRNEGSILRNIVFDTPVCIEKDTQYTLVLQVRAHYRRGNAYGYGAPNSYGYGPQNSSGYGAQTSYGAQNSYCFGAQKSSAYGAQNSSAYGAQNSSLTGYMGCNGHASVSEQGLEVQFFGSCKTSDHTHANAYMPIPLEIELSRNDGSILRYVLFDTPDCIEKDTHYTLVLKNEQTPVYYDIEVYHDIDVCHDIDDIHYDYGYKVEDTCLTGYMGCNGHALFLNKALKYNSLAATRPAITRMKILGSLNV